MKKQIIVSFDEDNNPVVEVRGVVGPDCEKITDDMVRSLGRVKRQIKTADYHKRAEGTRKVTQ